MSDEDGFAKPESALLESDSSESEEAEEAEEGSESLESEVSGPLLLASMSNGLESSDSASDESESSDSVSDDSDSDDSESSGLASGGTAAPRRVRTSPGNALRAPSMLSTALSIHALASLWPYTLTSSSSGPPKRASRCPTS